MRIKLPLLFATAAALLGSLPACTLSQPAEEPDDELAEPPRPASDVAAGGAVAPARVPEPAPAGVEYVSAEPNAALREVLLDQGWHRVGEVRVDGRGDTDRLRFARDETRFTRLVFFADRGDVDLDEITIVFADGSEYTPAFRDRIEEGTRTRVVRLPARHPPIDEVRFRYGTDPDDDAKLDVWGR